VVAQEEEEWFSFYDSVGIEIEWRGITMDSGWTYERLERNSRE
jgi:hypothetical protein